MRKQSGELLMFTDHQKQVPIWLLNKGRVCLRERHAVLIEVHRHLLVQSERPQCRLINTM